MYENETNENILKRMMSNVPSDVDKREGSIIFDSLAPNSIEYEILYASLDYFLKNTFGDTADREWLIERAKERGLEPYPATYSVARAIFTPAALEIPVGSHFSYDDIDFVITEKQAEGIYLMQCETAGTVGNVPAGKLIPNDYIRGLATAYLDEVVIPAEDEEPTEEFRVRYLSSFDNQAYGGNIADYKEKVMKIGGVGGIKVYPVWDGGGTVKVVFMTSEFKPPSEEFIERVQTILDPVPNNGRGIGVAPIGHRVTVEGVQNSSIKISFKLTFLGLLNSYKEKIENVIDEYFLELNKQWAETKIDIANNYSNTGITVRVAQLESRILGIEGIIDIENLTFNDVAGNLVLGYDELAVRGEIIWQ